MGTSHPRIFAVTYNPSSEHGEGNNWYGVYGLCVWSITFVMVGVVVVDSLDVVVDSLSVAGDTS